MNRVDFLQAKNFIFSDIQREVDIAKSNKNAGNFLCALALLCYTEFAGGIKRNKFGIGESKRNFCSFFKDLGKEYEQFQNKHDIYKIFRCGLAHEYYVKKSCTICMLKGIEEIGIGIGSDKRYYFVVERYSEDFKKAFDNLEKNIYDKIGNE